MSANIDITEEQKAQIRAELDAYKLSREAFEAAYAALVADHEGDWVAWHDGDAVFADSLDGALASATERGWNLGDVIVKKLLRERPAVLL